jgi:hypothetical protein
MENGVRSGIEKSGLGVVRFFAAMWAGEYEDIMP